MGTLRQPVEPTARGVVRAPSDVVNDHSGVPA
jgi:hypothetical protein